MLFVIGIGLGIVSLAGIAVLSPTIEGTEGDDQGVDGILEGTDGDDIIDGLGGDDEIEGLGGDDVLIGGEGADTLQGGDGDVDGHRRCQPAEYRLPLETNCPIRVLQQAAGRRYRVARG